MHVLPGARSRLAALTNRCTVDHIVSTPAKDGVARFVYTDVNQRAAALRSTLRETNPTRFRADAQDRAANGAAATSNEARARLAGKVQWVQSFVADGKTFCVYLAENEAAVQGSRS